MINKWYKNILYRMSFTSVFLFSAITSPMMRKKDSGSDYDTNRTRINTVFGVAVAGTMPFYWKMFKIARSFSGASRFKSVGAVVALSAFQYSSWKLLHYKNETYLHTPPVEADEWEQP